MSFGFKFNKGKNYFSFNLTEHAYFRFGFPKDFMTFIAYGNGANLGKAMNIGGFSINAVHYREMGVGISHKYNEEWTFGARYKLLFGMSNLWTKNTHLTITTAEEDFFITAEANLSMNACLPTDAWLAMEGDKNAEMNIGKYILNFNNMGMGADLGATYKLNKKFTFGASIIDLGYIKFKDDARNFNSINKNASFTFEGIDVNDYLGQPDSIRKERMNNYLDSIVDIFQIDTTENSYYYPLNTKLNLTAFYQLTPKDKVSSLAKIELWNGKIHPSFLLAYNRNFGNILSLTASYCASNHDYFNIGFGFNVNLGPLQIYVITDNVIDPIIHNKYSWMENGERRSITAPRQMNYFNIHFGINFIFEYKEKVNLPSNFEECPDFTD